MAAQMYIPHAASHGRQPRNEPLSYFRVNDVNKRARRVNIEYEGTTPGGQPYLGFMSRPLPTLPRDITRSITGYTTRDGRRVIGVTREDLWKLNRKHGRTEFLLPIHAMRREVQRLRTILDGDHSQEHLDHWRQEFNNARRGLNHLDDMLQSIIEFANASLYPAGEFHVFKANLDADKSDAQARLNDLTNDIDRYPFRPGSYPPYS